MGQPEDLSALQKSPLGVTTHIRAGITTDDDEEPDEERRAAMIAAVYCRKSTDQNGVADDQKSVARQIEHARQYAARKGWTVADDHVYVDAGISGAEFANRPGFLRLMNALKPRPPFHVLVMSEESRLGREAIETAYALKQLVQAGVRVFFYLEDRERTLDSPTDKIMLSLTAFADELEREKARQRTYDAMQRKAKAGHVTGGACFGYDNVNFLGPDGKRSHVERRINPAEAAIVQRIFQLRAEGVGQVRIARRLNAEGAIAPRSQQDRPRAWAPSTVREVLFRESYRGHLTWNQSRKRNQWGQRQQTARPTTEWMQVEAPQLRIVSDDLWQAAHRRIAAARTEYDKVTRLGRRPTGERVSKYLLPGIGRCALCKGGLHVRSRSHGSRRAFFYACTSHYNRGEAVCPHLTLWPMDEIDREIMATLCSDVFRPSVAETVVAAARKQFEAALRPEAHVAVRAELAKAEREVERLTEAIASGGAAIPAVMDRLRRAETTRQQLVERVAATPVTTPPKWADIERRIRRNLTAWRTRFTGGIAEARAGLKELLTAPILFVRRARASGHEVQRATRARKCIRRDDSGNGRYVPSGIRHQRSAVRTGENHYYLQQVPQPRRAREPIQSLVWIGREHQPTVDRLRQNLAGNGRCPPSRLRQSSSRRRRSFRNRAALNGCRAFAFAASRAASCSLRRRRSASRSFGAAVTAGIAPTVAMAAA